MRHWLPISVAAVCASCVGGGLSDRDQLLHAVEEFNEGMRWGRVEQSAAHLPLEKRKPFADKFTGLEDELEVMDYDLQRINYDKAKDTADAQVSISWMLKSRGVVERSVLDQHWEQKHSYWMLTRQSLRKGAKLPFIDVATAEPAAAPAPAATATPATTAAPATDDRPAADKQSNVR